MNKVILSNDPVSRKYSENTIKLKSAEKEFLQKKFEIGVGKKFFTLGFTGEITHNNVGEEFLKSLKILLELDIQILILAKAEKCFQKELGELHEKFPNKFLVLPNNEANLRDIYAISDSVLFLGGDKNLEISSLSYISVPIILKELNLDNSIFQDFNTLKETGNSFFIHGKTLPFIIEAILKAKETFSFVYDWGVLKTHCLNSFKNI